MELAQEKYKQTEVGLIPSDWKNIRIRSVCKLVNGRGFKPYEWQKNGLPIIRIQNLNGSDEYNYFQGQYDNKIEVEKGQLLFAWSGSRGTSFGPHVWKWNKGLLNYHTWKVLINEENVDNNFFLYALRLLTKSIEDQAHGASALVHIQKWEMEALFFSLPSTKTEQTAIATALSDADSYIECLEKLIVKKRLIKQGAMQELLTPKDGWKIKRIGDVLKVRHGKNQKAIEDLNGEYPILATGGQIGWTNTYLYNKPSVLIGRKGTIDKPQFMDSPFWTVDTLFYTEIFEENDEKFIFYLFNLIDWYLYNEASGVPSLNAKTIENHCCPE